MSNYGRRAADEHVNTLNFPFQQKEHRFINTHYRKNKKAALLSQDG